MRLPILRPWGIVLRLLYRAARIGVVALLAGLFLFGLTSPSHAFTAGETLGTVDMGSDTTLSAAVYDSSGQLVRHLYTASPQTGAVILTWDGKDDQGNPLPSGNYQWRAITTSAVGQDSGNIGNNGEPPYGASSDPMEPEAVAYDSSGNLYMISYYEEDRVRFAATAPRTSAPGRPRGRILPMGWGAARPSPPMAPMCTAGYRLRSEGAFSAITRAPASPPADGRPFRCRPETSPAWPSIATICGRRIKSPTRSSSITNQPARLLPAMPSPTRAASRPMATATPGWRAPAPRRGA